MNTARVIDDPNVVPSSTRAGSRTLSRAPTTATGRAVLATGIDMPQAQRSLRRWLTGHLPDEPDIEVEVEEVPTPTNARFAAATIPFNVTWTKDCERSTERFFARVAPSEGRAHVTYDLRKEAMVMLALAGDSDVRVPLARFHCDDPSVLGAPFLVVRRPLGGFPSGNPPLTVSSSGSELSDDQQATMAENGLQQLDSVHSTDWRSLGLGFLAGPGYHAGLGEQLAGWRRSLEWTAEDELHSMLDAAYDWLHRNQPADTEPNILNWGDARLDNVLFDSRLEVTGVVSWGMVALGPPEIDVASWALHLHHHDGEVNLPVPGGLPASTDLYARYEQITGTHLDDMHYFEVFAAARMATTFLRPVRRMIGGEMPLVRSELHRTNPWSNLLARLLGLGSDSKAPNTYLDRRRQA